MPLPAYFKASKAKGAGFARVSKGHGSRSAVERRCRLRSLRPRFADEDVRTLLVSERAYLAGEFERPFGASGALKSRV
jgi:hypothetical protein